VFEFEELDFDDVVEGLDICLPGVGAGWDGDMALTGDALDGKGIGAGLDSAGMSNVLGTVVGLPGGAGEIGAGFLERGIDVFGEEGGVDEGSFVGEAEEGEAGGDVARGVLEGGEAFELHLEIILGDVVEILRVVVDLLKEGPFAFDGAEVLLGLVLLAAFAG
jgi:hypothetical protein